jgi:hypothetical protein
MAGRFRQIDQKGAELRPSLKKQNPSEVIRANQSQTLGATSRQSRGNVQAAGGGKRQVQIDSGAARDRATVPSRPRASASSGYASHGPSDGGPLQPENCPLASAIYGFYDFVFSFSSFVTT